MSAKDIEDLKRKVYYMDRSVTPFLNIQIMKLYQLNSDLNLKVKELEEKITLLGSETSQDESKQNQEKKKKTNKKVEVTNDIRTITLE
jgi:hypothetical protein